VSWLSIRLASSGRPARGSYAVHSLDAHTVSLVEQLLTLHQQSGAAKTPDAQARSQRQIGATDRQIDRLVYELYGLTEEEIGIVEEGASPARAE
jgi:hypothetical protein